MWGAGLDLPSRKFANPYSRTIKNGLLNINFKSLEVFLDLIDHALAKKKSASCNYYQIFILLGLFKGSG